MPRMNSWMNVRVSGSRWKRNNNSIRKKTFKKSKVSEQANTYKSGTTDRIRCQIISTNPEVLLTLGKEELQKVKKDLEMVLSTVQSRNKKLKEDLEREQQWHDEQEKILDALKEIEKNMENEVVSHSKKRALQKLKDEILKVKAYKEELLNALGVFLEEHFPLPEEDGRAKKKKKKKSEEPDAQLITLHEILEILINKLLRTPHEPYVTINDSFWPPYIELLLRWGIALRHPEDPDRIRLEAFHQ
ncbi:centromere protein K isoform X2 [Anser cygnoides]|uniref:centromere protein K isoform X2 n=1 Tax=Anser cygnoides TaxID=8845 RepID=UPI0020091B02|nr:centromere protein K isoform X2 [Anser cygnoides]